MTTTKPRTCNVEGCPAPGHTPDEWVKGHYLKIPTIFWERGNGTVAIATVHDIASVGDPEANAALITRAPDLAHVLVGLVRAAQAIGVFPETYCWCGGAQIDHLAPAEQHTGECHEMRTALAAAEAALKGANDA